MSVRIVSQIFGSIAGVGAASTGLWIGISKFWNINDSEESPAELLEKTSDESPAESLDKSSDVLSDDKTTDEITNTPNDVNLIDSTEPNTETTQDQIVVTEIQTVQTITTEIISPPH